MGLLTGHGGVRLGMVPKSMTDPRYLGAVDRGVGVDPSR